MESNKPKEKEVKLAASITQNTDSISREAEIFYNAILDTPTFDQSLGVQIIPARDKFALVTGSTDSLIQSYSSTPSVGGTITTTDQEFSIFKQLIFTNFEYDALANTQWKDAIANMDEQGLPADLEEWIVEFVGRSTKATLANGLWNGNGGLSSDPTDFDGWGHVIQDILLDAGLTSQVIALGSDPTAAANIEGLLDTMIAAAPRALVADKENTRIMLGPVAYQALFRAYQQNAYSNIPTDNVNMFGGFRVQMIPNLSDDRIIIGKPSNLGLGLGVGNDIVNINVVDKYSQGDGNFARVYANFGVGAGAATTDWVLGEYPNT